MMTDAVGEETQEERADEQSGEGRRDKGADSGKAEKGLRGRGQKPAAVQPRRDIAGEEQIIDFETAAERQQNDEAPGIGRGGQAFEPARYLVGRA
jgi:hypothetical protein